MRLPVSGFVASIAQLLTTWFLALGTYAPVTMRGLDTITHDLGCLRVTTEAPYPLAWMSAAARCMAEPNERGQTRKR